MLRTERLLLRRWRAEDRDAFAEINADSLVMEFMRSTLSRQESDEFADRIEAHFERYGFGLFASELRHSQRFIGFIGLQMPALEMPFQQCFEIGWRLHASVWGNGLATEGALAVVHHAFQELALAEIISFTSAINTRSQRVMQKIGMTRDADGDFNHPRLAEGHPLRPHVLYRLTRSEWSQPPQSSSSGAGLRKGS